MCDPLTIGSIAIGLAGTAANSIGQANAAKKQQQEYNNWVNWQKKANATAEAAHNRARDEAEISRAATVNETLDVDSQKANQLAEENRLSEMLGGGGDVTEAGAQDIPTSIADAAISGSQSGGEVTQTHLARALSDATSSAQRRIQAMGEVLSFDTLGGMNNRALQESGADINTAGSKHGGINTVHNAYKNVDPGQVSYSNPAADILTSLGGAMGSLGASGGSLGSMFGKAASKVVADPWKGLRTATASFS